MLRSAEGPVTHPPRPLRPQHLYPRLLERPPIYLGILPTHSCSSLLQVIREITGYTVTPLQRSTALLLFHKKDAHTRPPARLPDWERVRYPTS
jgi:hypothetical protein